MIGWFSHFRSVLIFNDTNITTAIDPKLRFTHSAEKFMILKIYDYERVTVATIGGNNSTKLRAQSSLDKIFHYSYSLSRNQSTKESQSDRKKSRQCLLFAYLSSGNQPNNRSTILTDVWTISEQLVAIPVRVSTKRAMIYLPHTIFLRGNSVYNGCR